MTTKDPKNKNNQLRTLENILMVGNMYKLINPSFNEYRHFGISINGSKYLYPEEVLYLLDAKPQLYCPYYQMYKDFKDNSFNLLKINESSNKYAVYIKTKHFTRNKSTPIATAQLVDKEDRFLKWAENQNPLPLILGVAGEVENVYIKVESVGKLDMNSDAKDNKKWAKKPKT